jgi:hypothetical protein
MSKERIVGETKGERRENVDRTEGVNIGSNAGSNAGALDPTSDRISSRIDKHLAH